MKLSERWIGPFEISDSWKNNVRLELPNTMKVHNTFNIYYIRPFRSSMRFTRGVNFEPQAIETIEGADAWEVEQVLDKRKIGRGVQYLIKWKGYLRPEWINSQILETDIPEMIRNYEKNSIRQDTMRYNT